MSNPDYTPLKKCSTCKVEKPVSNFAKKSRTPDGLNGQCKACTAKSWQLYYEKHHDAMVARSKEYYVTHPKPDPAKHREYWARNREAIAARRKARYAVDALLREKNILRARAWVQENLEEQRKNARAYYAEHREERKRKVRLYELANPEKVKWWGRLKANQRRARLSGAGGAYTKDDVQTLYKLQKGKCANCHKKMGDEYHIDHKTPVALGGNNHRHNLELLCPTCNMRKSAKLPHIFAQEEGRLL